MLGDKLAKLEKKRIQRLSHGQLDIRLQPLYRHALPSARTLLSELKFTALDFETTGLNFASDSVLSFGGVEINGLQIDFASCFHHFIQQPNTINPDSVVINAITPEHLSAGLTPDAALHLLIERCAGRIIICHGAVIERTFLLKMLGLTPDFALPLIFLDTLKIERSLLRRRRGVEDLRLAAIRESRGLPAYVGHNALADSVATAEVFLAQIKDVFGKTAPCLGPLFARSQ